MPAIIFTQPKYSAQLMYSGACSSGALLRFAITVSPSSATTLEDDWACTSFPHEKIVDLFFNAWKTWIRDISVEDLEENIIISLYSPPDVKTRLPLTCLAKADGNIAFHH